MQTSIVVWRSTPFLQRPNPVTIGTPTYTDQHPTDFPKSYSLNGKRVGVVGCGSTGVQVITSIAPIVKSLTCFQRHPQYSVPSGDGPVSPSYRASVNENYDEIWKQVKNSMVAFGFEESSTPCMSVSEEERERKFEEAWQKGKLSSPFFASAFPNHSDIALY